MRSKNLILLIVGILLFLSPAIKAAKLLNMEINPPRMNIDLFFSGDEVNLSGTIPSDRNIIFEIIGPAEISKFNMKGKVGPFWMTRAKIELQNAPFMYLLLLPGDGDWEELFLKNDLGIESRKNELILSPEEMDLDSVFTMFVELKRSEGLYREIENAIQYTEENNGEKEFRAKFTLPSSTVPGEYKIVAREIYNEQIEIVGTWQYMVDEVGVVRRVRDLANENGLLYGVFCVFIALGVGAVIGLIFKRAEAH